MSGGFRVAPDELLEAVERMTVLGVTIDDVLDDTDAIVTRLHATWRGDAADLHRATHARWRAATRDMHEALARMRSIALTAHENYSGAAQANTRMWAAL